MVRARVNSNSWRMCEHKGMLILKSIPRASSRQPLPLWVMGFWVHKAQHGAEDSLLLPRLQVEWEARVSVSFVRWSGWGRRSRIASWIPVSERFSPFLLVRDALKFKENLRWRGGDRHGIDHLETALDQQPLCTEKLCLSKGSVHDLTSVPRKSICLWWYAEDRALSTGQQPPLFLMSDALSESH